MVKQSLFEKEKLVGHVAEQKETGDGYEFVLEDGSTKSLSREEFLAGYELGQRDKEIAPWQAPDYLVIPEINKVVEAPDNKPLKVVDDERAAELKAQADARDKDQGVTPKVDVKQREMVKEEQSRLEEPQKLKEVEKAAKDAQKEDAKK